MEAAAVKPDSSNEVGLEDVAMEEAFRHRLGSVLGRGSGAREHEDVRMADETANEEELRAGELLKYLMAVNGKSSVGSSLRFGFTK